MEYIGIGILIAIGFYLAPLIITVVGSLLLIIVAGIASIFTKK
jgi:hypothetical protein